MPPGLLRTSPANGQSFDPDTRARSRHQTRIAEFRATTVQRITDLFLHGAPEFNEEHVGLFDQVLGRLIDEIEINALAELSRRIAPVSNAPPNVIRQLARDADIRVAGAVLIASPRLTERDLVDLAKTTSQEHLLAISSREALRKVDHRRSGHARRSRRRARRRDE